MAMDITGRLLQVQPLQTGTSANGTWQRQEFIMETEGQYPKKVCVSLWGDKVNEIQSLTPGAVITVSVNPESREYNGRWYTDLRAWRIQQGAGAATPAPTYGGGEAMPTMAAAASAPASMGADQEAGDDLPF